MLNDFLTDDLQARISTEICIIGAGVAGQTLAMRLAASGKSVLLLESGGREFNANVQSLSDGDVSGAPYYDLISSRLRLFGGTAAIWGGRCAELDAIDFETRDYLPHSGWPISKADLNPYYAEAYRALGIHHPRSRPELGIAPGGGFDPDKIDVDFWRFDTNGERFTNVERGNLNSVRTIINATMTQMNVNEFGEVDSIEIRSVAGRSATVLAKVFVLAAGAIETVRLLMGAVPNRPDGLGNAKGLLGRFFMEHPHARGGEIRSDKLAHVLRAMPRALRIYGQRYAAYLRPSEQVQRAEAILNSSLSLAPRRHEGQTVEMLRALKTKLKHDLPSTRFWRSSYKALKDASVRLREKVDPWASIWSIKQPRSKLGLYAIIRAEQAPNPDSRIVLSERTDRFDMRLADMDWQFSDIDKRSVRVLMETLKSEISRLGWGEVELASWLKDEEVDWKIDPLISSHPIGGYHHMGGARMADTPSNGVVNRDCRLFESPNLYVASSSVFPTGGWANPTLTIMALAERLADHLTAARTSTS